MEINVTEVKQPIQQLGEVQHTAAPLSGGSILPGGLRPNPNRVKPVELVVEAADEPVQNVQHQSAPAPVQVDNSNVIKDLDHLLAKHPRVTISSRLLVKVMLTNSELENTDERAINDTRSVQTSGEKDLNFYSPFKMAKDEGEAPGFLRKPVFDLIKYLTSCNAQPVVLLNSTEKDVDQLFNGLNRGISNIVFKGFGTDDLVTYLEDDEQEVDDEDEDQESNAPSLSASDFVGVDTWKSVSFSDTGVVNVNYTVSLSIHSLEIYDAESQFKAVNKLKKMLTTWVEKLEATTLTVVLAVVLDNKMLAIPCIINTVDDFFQHEEDADPEYTFLTYNDVMSLAQDKEEAIVSLEDDSAGIWGEIDEIYPETKDVERLIKPSEFMYTVVISENADTLNDTEEGE